MRGVDYRTGHVYQLAADGSGEVHSDDCPHWSHGMSPFGAAMFDLTRRMTDAEVRRHGAEQLLSDFAADTEARAIRQQMPEPPVVAADDGEDDGILHDITGASE